MGAQQKFKNDYPSETQEVAEVQDVKEQKKHIDAYLKRINELLDDPEKQKKAALIINQLINSKN